MTVAKRPSKIARAAGTGASVPVEYCQVCGHAPLETVLSLGYMPPVNQMVPIVRKQANAFLAAPRVEGERFHYFETGI